ncbi:hypothetical protein C1645_822861 [Glomus cerebriforme]|uniref:Uncharacterized protein n=1 Tax=Glomus cerebriforme TaxID=658196 RepID=A0A397T3Y9_9GLOM|nr:hypothetical protein C1645_822861 [Glomus cerebriforme]
MNNSLVFGVIETTGTHDTEITPVGGIEVGNNDENNGEHDEEQHNGLGTGGIIGIIIALIVALVLIEILSLYNG